MQDKTQEDHCVHILHLWGMFYAFLGFSSFAIGDAGYKWLMQDIKFFDLIFYSSIFATSFLTILLFLQGGPQILKTKIPLIHAMRAVSMMSQFLCAIYAVQYLPLPLFYTIAFTSPAYAAILGQIFLKERVSKRNWIAIIVGLSGVTIALRPWDVLTGASEGDLQTMIAIGSILCSAMLISISQILARIIGHNNDSPIATAYYPILLVLLLSGFIYFTNLEGPAMPDLSFPTWGLIIGVAFMGVIGNVFMAIGFARAPAALASPFHYSQMIWGLLFGVLVFHDPVDPITMIGAALVIASGIYLVTHKIHMKKQIEDDPVATQI